MRPLTSADSGLLSLTQAEGESATSCVGDVSRGADRGFPLISDSHSYQDRVYALMKSLPDGVKASALCEGYLNNYTWFFRPLSRGELFQELLTPVLSYRNHSGHPFTGQKVARPHGIAALFFIFAITTSTDQSHAAESDGYYQLGKMALSLDSIFDAPQLDTIQAISLMAAYMSNSDGKDAIEEGWSYLGLAVRLAISVSGVFVP